MPVGRRTTLCGLTYLLVRLGVKETGAMPPSIPPKGGREILLFPERFVKKISGIIPST